MVLVFGKLHNNIGILQTKFRDREGHETRRIGLEAMPLDQDIEDSHGEREPGVEIRSRFDMSKVLTYDHPTDLCLSRRTVLYARTFPQAILRTFFEREG